MPVNNEATESTSTFESRTELKIGRQLPPPFAMMYISNFLRRTDRGGWLYSVIIVPGSGEFSKESSK